MKVAYLRFWHIPVDQQSVCFKPVLSWDFGNCPERTSLVYDVSTAYNFFPKASVLGVISAVINGVPVSFSMLSVCSPNRGSSAESHVLNFL